MDTYYEDLLNTISDYISQGDFAHAFALAQEELAMPYIPRDIEEKLISYYNVCRSEQRLKEQEPHVIKDIDTLLLGNMEETYQAIEQLKKSNIRNHLDAIRTYFAKNDRNVLARTLLIEALMEQGVTDEFQIAMQGMDVVFTPCAITMPMECEGTLQAIELLKAWFENDNPTFTTMCIETLVKEAYLRLPFEVDTQEVEAFASAIARYVFYAYEEMDAWKLFCEEKKLAQYSDYELLLSAYDM